MIKKYIDAVEEIYKKRNDTINTNVDKVINLGHAILIAAIIINLV